MKTNLSAEQGKAIQRYCEENNCKPALSPYPFVNIYFTNKETGKEVKVPLSTLMYNHAVAKIEEQKTRAEEKKRTERESKWKPITGR